jgi:hypothetical protein
VGRGLTRAVNAVARRRVGAILLREGLITPRELEEGLQHSARSGQRIGETLVELGRVTEETLDQAVALQSDEALGLLDALDGEDLSACIAATGIEGLLIMPAGKASAADAAVLSPAAFRRLLDKASRSFDVVIVDTGPILGSMEASIVTSQMDAVVLAVTKGDATAAIKKSIAQLSVVGARIAGVVFNRARAQDVLAYGGHSSSSYQSRTSSDGTAVEERNVPQAHRLGPVARAVASWSPTLSVGSRRSRRSAQTVAPAITN